MFLKCSTVYLSEITATTLTFALSLTATFFCADFCATRENTAFGVHSVK